MSAFLEVPPEDWVASNELAFAIRDRFPVSPGHTLVITRRLVATWFDATEAERAAVMALVEVVKRRLDEELHPHGYNVGFNSGEAAGQTVMHLHVHVIPRFRGDVDDPRGGVRHVIPARGNYLRRALATGGTADPFLTHLRPLFARAHSIDVVAAFVQDSGLELIHDDIEAALLRGARIRLVTGDYLHITQKQALDRLLAWVVVAREEQPGALEARVVEVERLSAPKTRPALAAPRSGRDTEAGGRRARRARRPRPRPRDPRRLSRGDWTGRRRPVRQGPQLHPAQEGRRVDHGRSRRGGCGTTTRLGRLLHIDDPGRLTWIRKKVGLGGPLADEADRKRALMLGYQLVHEPKRLMAAEDVTPWLRAQPAASAELAELVELLLDRVPLASDVQPVPNWPLVLHRHYGRREILSACGYWTETRKIPQQQGVLRFPALRREVLFVTLDKSTGGFSPTTRYKDYAISRDEFHWETQSSVGADSKTARHYIEHTARGWQMLLCVQRSKGEPFAFLGPVTYVRHSGDRPIAIIWRLEYPMPASLFQEYATLAGG